MRSNYGELVFPARGTCKRSFFRVYLIKEPGFPSHFARSLRKYFTLDVSKLQFCIYCFQTLSNRAFLVFLFFFPFSIQTLSTEFGSQ